MKYCVLIIDGSAGHPLPQRGGKTCLELARTPNLDVLAGKGRVGLARTVPEGMEPSSALACMSILGYDPRIYYKGRSAIEALSMGIDILEGEAVFRCNLVSVENGKMRDYSAGHITTAEAAELISSLHEALGSSSTRFYAGVSYRHILKLKGHEEAIKAVCTPPHDIPGKPVAGYLPFGQGSEILRDLMRRSENIMAGHPVNLARQSRGELPATTIWLFWPSGQVPSLPSFEKEHGLTAGMISGVDLLRGLAKMAGMEIIQVPGVTDGLDNDYRAQGEAAIKKLKDLDLVVVHVEAPDEAGHSGSIDHKVEAIEKTDQEIISRLRGFEADSLRLLVMPDHPTPIEIQTHTPEPVPFLLSGPGFTPSGAHRLTEAEGRASGFSIEAGYGIINRLVQP
ncbi:MAG: cofactor-independent phosphoglycerate mutase [Dehalococcoidales bacterium]|nr:cofactor-independent phosphoglycerate mutase [Dehalococcoidales bacterium]